MKSITLLSKGKTTCEVLSKQLINLLGDKIHINSRYLDGNIKSNITDDLIVISSNPLYDQVKNYPDPKCPFIIAKRSIDYNEICKLLYINPGTDVLLVNDTKESTDETISILKELGFGYINYFPYYPGIKNPAKLKIAITVGETRIIPQSVERVIDINIRKIDFTTMLDILKKLDLPDAEANLLSARFIKDIIDLLKRIKNVSDKNNEIKNELQTILNTVHDGIIAFNTNDTITVYNPIAEKIIGIRSDEIVDRKLSEDLVELLKLQNIDKEVLLEINNRNIVVNNYPICMEDTLLGRMYTLKDVTEIQRLEQELRRELRGKENCSYYTFNNTVGKSMTIENTRKLARKLAKSWSLILIQGESGVGKELFAQAIHNDSIRSNFQISSATFIGWLTDLIPSSSFDSITSSAVILTASMAFPMAIPFPHI